MSRQGKWDEMAELITDEMLNEFAVVGEPDHVVAEVKARYGGIVTSIGLSTLGSADPAALTAIRDQLA
jgi:hypothetical protein